MKHILNIFLNNKLIGKIVKENSNFIFQYSKEWLESKNAFAISISLQLQEEPFDKDISEAFFGNLLRSGPVVV